MSYCYFCLAFSMQQIFYYNLKKIIVDFYMHSYMNYMHMQLDIYDGYCHLCECECFSNDIIWPHDKRNIKKILMFSGFFIGT